jgi:hypothetical protein
VLRWLDRVELALRMQLQAGVDASAQRPDAVALQHLYFSMRCRMIPLVRSRRRCHIRASHSLTLFSCRACPSDGSRTCSQRSFEPSPSSFGRRPTTLAWSWATALRFVRFFLTVGAFVDPLIGVQLSREGEAWRFEPYTTHGNNRQLLWHAVNDVCELPHILRKVCFCCRRLRDVHATMLSGM